MSRRKNNLLKPNLVNTPPKRKSFHFIADGFKGAVASDSGSCLQRKKERSKTPKNDNLSQPQVAKPDNKITTDIEEAN